ncbi:hypothetical protein [Psychromonas aquatilis]|uniref:Uncharacterized protein n=1 Tax=Psychromonas aquatilis TaxID=2005072 RepID=A0ABU9GT42_9GAMM
MNNPIKSAINQLSNNALSKKALQKQYDVIANANLFDEEYYQVPASESDLYEDKLSHFLNVGWKANLDPSPYFSCQYYLYKNPDVAEEGINPLVHYIINGEKESRSPNVHFNPFDYLALNPDLAELESTLLFHYIQFGINEGRVFREKPLINQGETASE